MSDEHDSLVNTTEPTAPVSTIEDEAKVTAPEAESEDDKGTPETEARDPASEGDGETTEDRSDDDREEQSERKKTARDRIKQLTAQKYQLRSELAASQAEVMRLRQGLAEFDDQNLDDLDYEARESAMRRRDLREDRLSEAEAALEQRAAQAQAARRDAYFAKLEAASDRIPDIGQSLQIFTSLPVTEETAEFISESDQAAEITHFAARNPQWAAWLSQLPPMQQGIELSRLEDRLKSAPQPRKSTKAPPPPPQVGSTGTASTKEPAEMSQGEFNKWFNRQLAS